MQLEAFAEKQILQVWPTTHFRGAERSLDGSKAFCVPLCVGWKTTCASQPAGQDLPSS
jgi:hypothetical protein